MTDGTAEDQYSQMAIRCTRRPQLSLVHCTLCRWTWNTTYYICHDFGFLCFLGMRLWALKKTAVCWMHNPGIKSNILRIKATSNCVMTDKWSSRFLRKLNSCSSWETANRSSQSCVAVSHCRDFKYQQGVHCWVLPCCFRQVEVHHFNRIKTAIILYSNSKLQLTHGRRIKKATSCL